MAVDLRIRLHRWPLSTRRWLHNGDSATPARRGAHFSVGRDPADFFSLKTRKSTGLRGQAERACARPPAVDLNPWAATALAGICRLAAVTAPAGVGNRKEVQIMKTATKAVTAKSVGRGSQSRDPGAKAAAAPKTKGRAPVRAVRAKRTVPEPKPSAAPARRSKKAAVIALLQRPEGAAIGDLTDATGWQVHSVRAALTGP